MRVPLSWLGEYVDLEVSPEELASRLTLLGFEVQGIERWGSDWQGVVVGELLSVEPHPRADRLSLARVTVGEGEPLEIVCGATNIAAGQRVPVALPGAVLPGDRPIERTEKMGVVSNGMLCSGDELHLTADADGILILPPETRLGARLDALYGDVVLDVDVKPNRGDALSLVGLAREISATTGAPVRFPPVEVAESGAPVEERLRVTVEDPVLCTRFVGRWVDGVRVAPSPDAVQMRLLAAGMRPVSNVVDASNYVMLELGKPIHTFDAAAVHDGRIVVRVAQDGERLETLDHVERELTPDTLLIADPAGPLAIAGVMGGATSEIGETTRAVVIESAIFDPVSVRRTAFRYGLRSEASLRFEKGQEPRLARLGADRTARLIREWAGGAVAPGRIDVGAPEPQRARVAFRPAQVARLLGADLPSETQRTLLERVGVEVETAESTERVPVALDPTPLHVLAEPAATLVAVVPTWRGDLRVEADIAEEIARIHGYERIPPALPDTPMPPFRPDPLEARDAVRRLLAGAGLTEVVTHALVSPAMVERFGALDDGPVPGGEAAAGGSVISVTNPLSREHSVLRRSLLGSLLEVVGVNRRHGRDGVAIFEIGKGYGWDAAGVREWWRLGIALTGTARPPHWSDAPRPFDLDDAKGLLELLAERLRLGAVRYAALRDAPGLHPGRTARVMAGPGSDGPGLVGRVGEVHPDRVDELDLRADRVVVAELAIGGLSGGRPPAVRAVAPARTPLVERDLAIVVGEAVSAAEIETVIRAHAGEHLEGLRLFDIYRGSPLAAGEKSLAYRLAFQDPERTLTDPEIDAAIEAITGGLAAIGGRIRG